jgi:hypothetical protein
MDLLPELPARLASKRFAQVLNRLFHALRYGLVSARCVQTSVPHQGLYRVWVAYLR